MLVQQKTEKMHALYSQNQKLAYRINYLSDENNFYRISINNIKKLNTNINKNITSTSSKFLNNKDNLNTIDPKNITQPYTIINNKIQLKNLQMKVGNSKRRVDNLKKIYEGSLSSLVKRAEVLQDEVNKLAREYEYHTIQNQLLSNIYMADFYETIYRPTNTQQYRYRSKQSNYSSVKFDIPNNATMSTKISGTQTPLISRKQSLHNLQNQKYTEKTDQFKSTSSHKLQKAISSSDKILMLEESQIKLSNKLQQLVKQSKSLKNEKNEILNRIKQMNIQRNKYLPLLEQTINFREIQSSQFIRLQKLTQQQKSLELEIVKQDKLLQQQYKINQDYKQKIIDRNEQEIKQIKVLQEEIKKCSDQVKQIKLKYKNLSASNPRTVAKPSPGFYN